MARTALTGLLGALVLFVFSWYRGELGAVDLGALGVVDEPGPRAPTAQERLADLTPRERALGGEFASADAQTAPLRAMFFAGQLLAFPAPERVVDEGPDAEPRTVGGVAAAIAAAEAYGVARPAGGGALLLDLTAYGLDAPFAEREEGPWPERVVRDESVSCADPVDEERAAREPAYAVACVIAALEASGQFAWIERNHVAQVAALPNTPPRRAARVRALRAQVQTARVSAEDAATSEGVLAPDDPLFSYQWHFGAQGLVEAAASGGAGFVGYWRRRDPSDAVDVAVAVIDAGVDAAHPDIPAAQALGEGVDMVSALDFSGDGDGRDLDPAEVPREASASTCASSGPASVQHGTHVAGLVGAAAADNGSGVAGAAWNATVIPVRAVGPCGALKSDVNDAIRWAAGAGATIVTGPRGAPMVRQNPSPARIVLVSVSFPAPLGCPRSTQEAIDAAVAAGAIIVAPAGNGGVDARAASPGNCAGVLTVAAADAAGRLAYYSNHGPRVDVMAPGGDLRRDLNGDGRPDGVLSTSAARDCYDPVTGRIVAACDYAFAAGSSFAAAHVAGALALLAADRPDAPREELISLIVDTARSPRTPQQCPRLCGSGLLDLERVAPIEPRAEPQNAL